MSEAWLRLIRLIILSFDWNVRIEVGLEESLVKTIKIHFVGFWESLDFENNIFTALLKRRYHVVFDDKNPDFLFCSAL